MKSGRWVQAVFASIALALSLGAGGARAETTGDLYVSSADGILELVTSSSSVLGTVSEPAGFGQIAIRPDGRELFALSGKRNIVRLDLESMEITSHVLLPAPGAALAHPNGEQLVAAVPSLRRLAILDTGTGTLSRSEALPGAVDLLAADPRDGRVAAAARGEGWVAILDPDNGSVRSTTIAGSVVAVAIDGRAGIVVVATSSPNRIVALDLRDFATAWSMPMSAAPSAVAVTADRTFVAAARTIWVLDRVASPGWPFVGAPSSEPSARRWASLAKPAASLAMSDDGAFLYTLEADRIEGFAVSLPAADASAAASATRTVLLAGSRTPLAIVAVPGAKPFLGGPASDPQSDVPAAGPGGTTPPAAAGPDPGGATPSAPPRTDTVFEDVVRWVDGGQALPGALLVGVVILVLGLGAIRWYERSGEARPADRMR